MWVLDEDKAGIRVLTLNDPQARNPLSTELSKALLDALEDAGAAREVRVVVLTGAGTAFSAGADLNLLRKVTRQGAEANLAHSRALMRLFQAVYFFPKPIVAAVNGPAVAGGAGLANACDLVIMDEKAKIGYTEVRIGFVAALVAVLLVRNVGEKHAKELLLTGRLINAQEAWRMGLVNRIAPAGKALTEAIELATEVSHGAPASLALTKELLVVLPSTGIEEGFRLAALANAWIRETGNLKEGIRAFFEKRPPHF